MFFIVPCLLLFIQTVFLAHQRDALDHFCASVPFSNLLGVLEELVASEILSSCFLTASARQARLQSAYFKLLSKAFATPGCLLKAMKLAENEIFTAVDDKLVSFLPNRAVFGTLLKSNLLKMHSIKSSIKTLKMPFEGRFLGNPMHGKLHLDKWLFFLQGKKFILPSVEQIKENLYNLGCDQVMLSEYEGKIMLSRTKRDVLYMLLQKALLAFSRFYLLEENLLKLVYSLIPVQQLLVAIPKSTVEKKFVMIKSLPKGGTLIYKDEPLFSYLPLDQEINQNQRWWDVPCEKELASDDLFVLWSRTNDRNQGLPLIYEYGQNGDDKPLLLAFKFKGSDTASRKGILRKFRSIYQIKFDLISTFEEKSTLKDFEKNMENLKSIASAVYSGYSMTKFCVDLRDMARYFKEETSGDEDDN